jgi:sugar phosphate isomerase/epimerase
MQVGIFAKTFSGNNATDVLNAVRGAGYGCTQFNMACVGLPTMPDAIPATILAAIGEAGKDSGVVLSALSATYNMIHPDLSEREAGMRRLAVVADAARALQIPLVTLCTGTRDAQDQWRHHPDNARPEAWADLTLEMERALAIADAAGIALGIEPEQANVVTSVQDALRLIETFGSPRLRIVLDPANLFERATRDEARTIVARSVGLAGAAIAMAHAKDRDVAGNFVAAGQGVVDFPDFVARLRAVGFDGPLVTHGLTAAQAPGVAAFLTGLVGR